MESIYFRFSGGMADQNQMNFYEASRFQYGAARFVYTLEKFRLEGNIASRLAGWVDTDIRVSAPAPGSFIQEVLVMAAPIAAEVAMGCSFEALFAYVWDLLLPQSKAKDIALKIAEQERLREEQRTQQEVQRTEQTRLMADVCLASNATTQQVISILGQVVSRNQPVEVDGQTYSNAELKSLLAEAESESERKQLIHANQAVLSQITPEKERRLVGQLRKPINDMCLPLRSSATNLNISQGTSASPRKMVNLTAETVQGIAQQLEDDAPIVIRGSVKAYDRENGTGKFRYDELRVPIPFRIPSASKVELQPKILDAMRMPDVLISVFFIRDSYDNPVSLIIDNILDQEAGNSIV